MNRRSFLALASGLLVPVPEPVRSYFFAPMGGWAAADEETDEQLRARVRRKLEELLVGGGSVSDAIRPRPRMRLDPSNPKRLLVDWEPEFIDINMRFG